MDTRRTWTPTEVNALKKLRDDQQESWKTIAKKLGKTEHGVRNRYRREKGQIE
jgi:DNA-binding Lrp family transcriptional regulator